MNARKTSLTLVGAAFATAAGFAGVAHAAANPFAMQALPAGYQLAAADSKAKDGSCGGDKAVVEKKQDGSCGAEKQAADKMAAAKTKDGSCGDDGHLYDLLPIPFTGEAVRWVASRIRRAQDILEMRIGIENASFYVAPPGAEMSEVEFIRAAVEEADCLLHLDVNNIYVNSRNFGFDALDFMEALPLERACYLHIAGHYVEPDGIRVDTHGAAVIDPVWSLLDAAYARIGPLPTCLERDFNIPPLLELLGEVGRIAAAQARAVEPSARAA